MPWLVSVLVGLCWKAFESLAGRLLIALGVGIITTTGLDLMFGSLKSQTLTALTGIPTAWAQLLGLSQIDVCVSMVMGAVISAYAVRYAAGAVSRFAARPTW